MPSYVENVEQKTFPFENNGTYMSFEKDIPFLSMKGDTLEYIDTKEKYQFETRETEVEQIRSYFKKLSTDFNHIDLNESIISGMPVIRNTRIPVSLIISCLKDNMTIDEITEDYNISNADIVEALEFTIELLKRPYMDE